MTTYTKVNVAVCCGLLAATIADYVMYHQDLAAHLALIVLIVLTMLKYIENNPS